MAEIIDLTTSPSRPEIIEISSDQEDTSGLPSRVQESKKRRKNLKRNAKPSNGRTTDEIDSSSRPSRAHSQENGNQESESNEPTSFYRSSSPLLQLSSRADDEIFTLDACPVPVTVVDSLPESAPPESNDNKLLLPSHVLVGHEEGPVSTEILPSLQLGSSDEEYIEYLDYEDRKGVGSARYFNAEGEDFNKSRTSIFKCKNCGAEGDHKTYECPIQICLTCGARDEHSTRSCPISKTCYACGMKGHINKTCPNRFSTHVGPSDLHGDCDRCGSTEHQTNECPTIWRIYQYVNDEERVIIMQSREEKKQFAIGDGGEGYIGADLWCYHCANTGHLGDDCNELPYSTTFPAEHSAFSSHNMMSGPFYDPAVELVYVKYGPRERAGELDWDAGPPVDVGRRGKRKDKEKLEKRSREQEGEDNDWFNDIRNVRRRGTDQQAPGPREKTLKFASFKDRGYEPSLPATDGPPSLLARLGGIPRGKFREKVDRGRDRGGSPPSRDSIRIRGAASDPKNQDGTLSASHRTESQNRWDRDKQSRRGHGPRYRGGYDR